MEPEQTTEEKPAPCHACVSQKKTQVIKRPLPPGPLKGGRGKKGKSICVLHRQLEGRRGLVVAGTHQLVVSPHVRVLGAVTVLEPTT